MENIQHILLSEKITEVYVCYDPIFLMSTWVDEKIKKVQDKTVNNAYPYLPIYFFQTFKKHPFVHKK